MAELKLDLSRVDQVVAAAANNAGMDDGGGDLGGEEGGGEIDSLTDMYETLPPLEKLERYFQSEDVMDREMAVRCIPEALEVATSYSEYQLILEISMTLANDHEPTIRMLILDTVAMLLQHHSRLCLTADSDNGMENKERLFDVPIRMVSDINQQVRRISQNCVVNLLEDDTKNKDVLINQLVPEMERCLSRDEHYDLRMDMSLLLSRLAPLLGRGILVNKFVPLFPSLGRDAMFHVRKAFAMGCRDICPVLGEDLTEKHILQPFSDLCHDDVWGVRKACADVFADVAMSCNLGTRHDRLTPTFLRLLQDDSRWVRRAAFEHLGSFIATFYVPGYGEDEEVEEDDEEDEEEEEHEQSSINPFSDSVLMDNSLLSSHEQDGIWVGGDDDGDKATPTSTDCEIRSSSSGTEMRQSGIGAEPRREGEEPFFLFMDTPSSQVGGGGGVGEEEGERRGNDGDGEEGEKKDEEEKLSEKEGESAGDRGKEEEEEEEEEGRERSQILELSITDQEGTSSSTEDEKSESSPSSEDTSPRQPGERLTLDLREGALIGEPDTPEDADESGGEKQHTEIESKPHDKDEGGLHRVDGGHLLEQPEPPAQQEEEEKEEGEEGEEEGDGGREEDEVVAASQNTTEEKEEEEEEQAEKKEEEQEEKEEEETKSKEFPEEPKISIDDEMAGGCGQEAESVNVPVTGEIETQSETSSRLEQNEDCTPADSTVREDECEETEEKNSRENEEEVEGNGDGEIEEGIDRTDEIGEDGGGGGGGGGGGDGSGGGGGGESEEIKDPSQTAFPPIRVVVHTEGGQVMEPTCDDSNSSLLSSHNQTYCHDNIVSMDLTLASTLDTSANTTMIDPFAEEGPSQEIVPDELMDLYLSMTDSTKSQTVDSDLPYYCAFCLPGVVLTLGVRNWPLLRTTFLALCGDLQWKIRRVLSFSLHELARILGTETTVTDLYPTFEEYCTKDVDDVKIGVLTHLSDFIEILPVSLRRSCLPDILRGLRDVENPKNWRHKYTLVEQLVTICDLYDADYLHSHIYPVAKELMKDRVHQVRDSATHLLGMILQRLTQITPDGYLPILREMKTEYAIHHWWSFRQLYVSQCRIFVSERCVSSEVFVSECLPTLLSLTSDKVPNVRLALARTVREILINSDYFRGEREETERQLQSALDALQRDTDRDVIYFSGGDVSSFVRPRPLQEAGSSLRYRSQSQASEDQYHDAIDTLEGGRQHESWLHSWEEALAGPTLQMTGEIR